MRLFEYLKFRCGARGTGRELLRGSVLCVVFGTDVLYAFVERGAALFFWFVAFYIVQDEPSC